MKSKNQILFFISQRLNFNLRSRDDELIEIGYHFFEIFSFGGRFTCLKKILFEEKQVVLEVLCFLLGKSGRR